MSINYEEELERLHENFRHCKSEDNQDCIIGMINDVYVKLGIVERIDVNAPIPRDLPITVSATEIRICNAIRVGMDDRLLLRQILNERQNEVDQIVKDKNRTIVALKELLEKKTGLK